MYMAVRWLKVSARISSSSVFSFSTAYTATGLVAQMPWLPEPELLITGIIAPPIRASQADAVFDMMCENMELPKMPWLNGRSMVLPRQCP